MIVKKPDGYHVTSKKGKNLGGPYKTKSAAEKRLREVEFFKHKKESMVRGLEIKEVEGEFYVQGMIATTHIDAVGDMIPESTLQRWAEAINSGNPQVNKVSYHHNREEKVVGKGDHAFVTTLPDGHSGLVVETHVNKSWDGFDDLVYEVENGFVDGFSIEYNTNQGRTTTNKEVGGVNIRVLEPGTNLYGWGFASRPVQAEASIQSFGFKEIITKKYEEKGETMKEDNKEKLDFKEDAPPALAKEAPVEEPKKEVPADKPEEAPADKPEEAPAKEPEAESKEFKDFKAWKEQNEKKEMIDNIAKEVIKKVEQMEVKEKVLKTEEKTASEVPLEVKEFHEVLERKKEISVKEQFARAGALTEKYGLLDRGTSRVVDREFKSFGTNGRALEYKGLGITTNQNTDTDYLQSSAELQDVYDPVIYNALNEKTVTWNLLAKDDFSGKGNNQVQFVLKTAANTTAAFYTGTSVTTGNTTRLKYQTKFKKLQVGVSVDGDMIAAARGGPVGDVFAQEVMDATESMLSVLNAALFAEAGLETVAAPIGFEYISDSAGNTTLYNLTRSAANKLSPDSAGDTYIDQSSTRISMTNLRAAIKQAVTEGASKSNLVFITAPLQANLLRGKFDDSRRMLTTRDSEFGFSTDLWVDGIPVFEDKDCNTDDWWLIDLETHRAGIWIPPTIEKLGKSGDSEDAFIKMYVAVYNRAPRRLVQIYGAATS